MFGNKWEIHEESTNPIFFAIPRTNISHWEDFTCTYIARKKYWFRCTNLQKLKPPNCKGENEGFYWAKLLGIYNFQTWPSSQDFVESESIFFENLIAKCDLRLVWSRIELSSLSQCLIRCRAQWHDDHKISICIWS